MTDETPDKVLKMSREELSEYIANYLTTRLEELGRLRFSCQESVHLQRLLENHTSGHILVSSRGCFHTTCVPTLQLQHGGSHWCHL